MRRALSCVLVCILILLSQTVSSISLEPSQWAFSREITLSGSRALSDYQVRIVLDTGSLIGAGKMRPDCGDVRFADTDKFSSLSYFLESGCATDETVFWVNVPVIAPEKRIYLYYGSPSSVSESSGERTFAFYEDFSSGVLDSSKWHAQSCVEIKDGYAHLSLVNGSCSLKSEREVPQSGVIQLKARRGPNETGGGPWMQVSYEDNSSAFDLAADPKEGRWVLYFRRPSPTGIYGAKIDGDDHVFSMAYDAAGKLHYLLTDSSTVARNRAFAPGRLTTLQLLSGSVPSAGRTSDSYYDYVLIRRYADPEPEVTVHKERYSPSSEGASPPENEKPAEPDTLRASQATTSSTELSASTTLAAQEGSTAGSGDSRQERTPEVSNTSFVQKSDSMLFSNYFWLIALAAILLTLIGGALYKRRADSMKENKEVLRWIADELLSGENPEVIKKAVRDSGMDPALVDKAKRILK